MISANYQRVVDDLKQLDRDLSNAERRAVRRAISAGYDAAWNIAKTEFPPLSKNSASKGMRSFSARTKRFLSLSKSPMFGEISAEIRRINSIHAVKGTKEFISQKGLSMRNRKKIVLQLGRPLRGKGSLPFLAPVSKWGKRTFVFVRKPLGVLAKQSVEGIWDLLTDNIQPIVDAADAAINHELEHL